MTRLVAFVGAGLLAVIGTLVAIAVTISPVPSAPTHSATRVIAGGPANIIEPAQVELAATAEETAAFYAHLAPKVGDRVAGSRIVSVTNSGLGCYSYTLETNANQTVLFCSDVSAQSFRDWVLNYRKSH